MNVGERIILELNLLYKGNKKLFFLLGLIIVLCKVVGVAPIDTRDILYMDQPFYPLLIR